MGKTAHPIDGLSAKKQRAAAPRSLGNSWKADGRAAALPPPAAAGEAAGMKQSHSRKLSAACDHGEPALGLEPFPLASETKTTWSGLTIRRERKPVSNQR